MDKLAEKAGFTLFASKQLYKNISIFNKKISTFYLADKIGPFWCDVINKLYPGQSTINIRIYRKSNSENIG